MARILLLMTRPLDGAGGRGQVLSTIIGSLGRNGHDVVCAVVGGPAVPDAVAGASAVHRLPDVARLEALTGRAARARGLRSFNERLYYSPRISAAVARIVQTERIDAVIADGVRMAPYAEDSGRPWFVDLDDLLSARYALWRDRRMNLYQLLGHRRPGSAVAGRALRAIPTRRVLDREAKALAEREISLSRRARGTSLVSPVEAATLAASSGTHVRCLPMAVTTEDHREWPVPAGLDRRLAFAGSLTAFANEEAVRWWIDELEPALRAEGLPGWELHVFGHVPDGVRERVTAPSVVLRGAFPRDQLHRELVQYSFSVAPQREALGLTVKVVESAVLGLVTLTTPQGASGLRVTDGEQVLLFSDGPGLARALRRVEGWAAHDPDALVALAARGRRWAVEGFSAETLAKQWGEVVDELLPGMTEAPVGSPAP